MNNLQKLNITDLKDPSQFESLFRSYYEPLIGFAFQYVRDNILAEELVQDVFSTLWTKRAQIHIKTNIKSYLFGSVRNSCLNHLKHQKIIAVHETYTRQNIQMESNEFMELDELQEMIEKALEELPPKCREIFELSRFEEMKYKEIAEQLNISIKTVETQMSKALKVMRTSLSPYLPVYILWLWLYG